MPKICVCLMALLVTLTLAGCSTTLHTPRRIPVHIKEIAGEPVDRAHLASRYAIALGARTGGGLVNDDSCSTAWQLYPSVSVERDGIGNTLVVTVAIRHPLTQAWIASRRFTDLTVFGPDKREAQVEALLNQSVAFVHKTLTVQHPLDCWAPAGRYR